MRSNISRFGYVELKRCCLPEDKQERRQLNHSSSFPFSDESKENTPRYISLFISQTFYLERFENIRGIALAPPYDFALE